MCVSPIALFHQACFLSIIIELRCYPLMQQGSVAQSVPKRLCPLNVDNKESSSIFSLCDGRKCPSAQ